MPGDWNEDSAWYKATTGAPTRSKYWNIRRDPRGFPIFVKSRDDGDADYDASDNGVIDREGLDSEPRGEETGSDLVIEKPSRPNESIAELYRRLASQSSVAKTSARPPSTSSAGSSSRRQGRLQAKAAKNSIIVSHEVPVQCHGCKAVLTPPVTVAALEAHQASIGHQLAVDKDAVVPNPLPRAAIVKARPKDDVTVLQSFNVGYIALEKMGWHSGMGLGRDEWDGAEQSNGTSVQTESEETTLPSSPTSKRARPLLEPIPLLKRPDRRGIGNALPASAKVRDRPRPLSSQAVVSKSETAKKTAKKLKPHQRHRREQEELKALRQSLNS